MINCKDFTKADGVILSAGYGRSSSYRGGSEDGPRKTLDVFSNNLEAFNRFTLNCPYKIVSIGHHELLDLNMNTPEQMAQRIADFYLAHGDKFILMLGGDHSVSIGAFRALAQAYDPSDVTIVQIDAHPDLRDTPYDYKLSHEKIDHACPMRRAVELGFRTVQVGIRTISLIDHEFIRKNKLKVFEWGRKRTPTTKAIISAIKTKKVYLTFDMDGLDPAHAPGTGTPVPGGLEWSYALKLIRDLVSAKKIIAADIVEIAATKDDALTPYSAAHLCYDILSYALLKRKKMLKFYNGAV